MNQEHGKNFYEGFAATALRLQDRIAVELQYPDRLETASYAELHGWAEAVAGFLASRNICAGDTCAIFADNEIAWCAAYLGILRLGALAIPLDTHYAPRQIAALLRDSGAKIVFTAAQYFAVVEEARRLAGSPAALVLLHGWQPGIESFEEFRSAEWPALPASGITRQDPAVILYTSGTTSDPKGVVLTHGNLLAEVEAVTRVVDINERDSILGVMPLYHALAQMANLLLPFLVGARVIYLNELNTSELLKALRDRGATAFCCVPQFFYLIHQRLHKKVAEAGWARAFFFRALLRTNAALRRWTGLNLGPWFFRSIHDVVGSKIRFLVTGGARFDPSVGLDFYRLGFNLLEAYGLTECSGAATVTRPGEGGKGSVGVPLPDIEVKILPAGSTAGNGVSDGEIAIRGPIVMNGYFHRPDATAETLREGWLFTGDLGYLDEKGRLRVTGRKKEVIVLSSGKNIYPEEVEAHYAQSPYIEELCVLGLTAPDEPATERLHGIVVPNLEVMQARKVLNMKEVLRFEIENLSVHLPAHKRILSYEISMEALPRTTTNKLKRYKIEQQARLRARGTEKEAASAKPLTDAAAAWAAHADVVRALALIREVAHDQHAVHPDANLELDLGLDSIERVELLASLEQSFGTRVPAEVAQSVYTVRQLVDAVRAQQCAPASGHLVQAWSKLLSDLPEDEPLFSNLLRPHRLFAPVAFVVLKVWYWLARLLLRFRVSGFEHLPKEDAYLICPNHQSYVDPFLLVSALPFRTFRNLFFVGASEYFATPVRQRAARLMHVAPVNPDTHLLRAMQAAAFGLRRGKTLVLFPEGERSIDGEVKKFRKGVAILALHLQAPVVPVAFDGVFDVWPRNRSFRWRALLPRNGARVRLHFGPVFPPPPPLAAHLSPAQVEARYAAFAE